MIEVKGKFTDAKVFTETVQETAMEQVQELCDQVFMKGVKVRIMPDYHAGAGSVVGTTIKITDKVVPNLVGGDIGCGILTVRLDLAGVNFEDLDDVIREHVPSGKNQHEDVDTTRDNGGLLAETFKANVQSNSRMNVNMGTLGGGNHFIEVSVDEEGMYYLTIHTGSRVVGTQVAKYYQKQADKLRKKASATKLINELKEQGRFLEIKEAVKQFFIANPTVPKMLAYVEGEMFDDYLHDMKLAQNYAALNRKTISDLIIREMGWEKAVREEFDTVHNYIDTDNMMLRKGAVSAQKGEMLIIPINMRDGSIIAMGKGNSDWNYSAPHGAGRMYTRTRAREELTLEDFKTAMKGVWTTSVNDVTLDEAPDVYKSMGEILSQIGDTVDVLTVIKPVYNYKASEVYVPKTPLELYTLEIGSSSPLDVQSARHTYMGTLEDYKKKVEADIQKDAENLTLIDCSYLMGEHGLYVKYYAKNMNKEVVSYIIPTNNVVDFDKMSE